MRKLFIFDMVTLDWFFEGENHDLSWHNTDEEFQEFAIKQLDEIETIIFGRVTYEMMAEYWSSEEALQTDSQTAEIMTGKEKYVVSKTLEKAEWNNTKIISGNIEDEIKNLKQREGKDIAIFGSSDLSLSLLKLNLIDEMRIIINPLILGKGKHLFEANDQKLKLILTEERKFKNGNLLLYYKL